MSFQNKISSFIILFTVSNIINSLLTIILISINKAVKNEPIKKQITDESAHWNKKLKIDFNNNNNIKFQSLSLSPHDLFCCPTSFFFLLFHLFTLCSCFQNRTEFKSIIWLKYNLFKRTSNTRKENHLKCNKNNK